MNRRRNASAVAIFTEQGHDHIQRAVSPRDVQANLIHDPPGIRARHRRRLQAHHELQHLVLLVCGQFPQLLQDGFDGRHADFSPDPTLHQPYRARQTTARRSSACQPGFGLLL
jgi:hypothetical protein